MSGPPAKGPFHPDRIAERVAEYGMTTPTPDLPPCVCEECDPECPFLAASGDICDECLMGNHADGPEEDS